MVDQSHLARMFTVVARVDAAALLIGGPIAPLLLNAGDYGSWKQGILFAMAAVSSLAHVFA